MLPMVGSVIRKVVPERFRPIGYLTHLTRKRTRCRVRLGPFAGMRYAQNSVGSAYLPKLLGIYERELTLHVEAICRGTPSLIVDLGTAEGYYAVGVAVRNPQARDVGVALDTRGREALEQMSVLNGSADRLT